MPLVLLPSHTFRAYSTPGAALHIEMQWVEKSDSSFSHVVPLNFYLSNLCRQVLPKEGDLQLEILNELDGLDFECIEEDDSDPTDYYALYQRQEGLFLHDHPFPFLLSRPLKMTTTLTLHCNFVENCKLIELSLVSEGQGGGDHGVPPDREFPFHYLDWSGLRLEES